MTGRAGRASPRARATRDGAPAGARTPGDPRDVLGRVGPVDAEDHRLGSRVEQIALPLEHRRAHCQRRELVRVDRDRMRGDERVAGVEAQRAARRLERLPPAIRVEADDVAAEQARRGSTRRSRPAAPTSLQVDPRNVREVRDHRVRQPLSHEPRRQVQVVVVEEDGRARVAVQLLDDCVGECPVDGGVTLFPRRAEVVLGLVLELPQPVLDASSTGCGSSSTSPSVTSARPGKRGMPRSTRHSPTQSSRSWTAIRARPSSSTTTTCTWRRGRARAGARRGDRALRHIPWVDPDGWSVLPDEIVRAIHGACSVATSSASTRSLAGGVPVDVRRVGLDAGRTLVTAHPISIDPDEFTALAASPRCSSGSATARLATRDDDPPRRPDRPGQERPAGLQAFALLLERRPELHGRVGCSPCSTRHGRRSPSTSTSAGGSRRRLRRSRRFPVPSGCGSPTTSISRSPPYKQFDVLLVNAVMDGLNLVAKEAPYVNARDGTVVLSVNAGAYEEIGAWTVPVEPLDVEGKRTRSRPRSRCRRKSAAHGSTRSGSTFAATTSRVGSTRSFPTSTAPVRCGGNDRPLACR